MHATAGYAPIMPTYQGQISEEGLIDLVEYIKRLNTQLPHPADADDSSAQSDPDGAAGASGTRSGTAPGMVKP